MAAEKKAPAYLETYATVAERLAMFWMEHPLGQIHTNPAEYPDDNIVRVRAIIFRWDEATNCFRLLSTGQAEEVREGYINANAATENCETSAVGRALAMAGYGINKGVASAEEIELAERRRRARAPEDAPQGESIESRLAEGQAPTEATPADPGNGAEPASDIDELVKQIVLYVGKEDENPQEYAIRKEFVKAKLMSLGVENPLGVRESVLVLSKENRTALAE